MKHTQLLVPGAILVLLASGLAYMARDKGGVDSPTATSNGASVLTANETDFDFGTIKMSDGKVTHSFEVANVGSAPIMVTSVYTSCMCTTALVTDAGGKESGPFGMPGHTSPYTEILIGIGETARVVAVFDPAAHGPSGVGLADRSIYLETNSAQTPRVELKFKALVTR
ncbi:MAG: hypothetical protein A3D67_01180 [Candidatus Lloydbacteria bacterium RIFCSPHIGHO2_02_FULL_51_22]|uniref:DUF1573 domain-containing protein n=2 Tax=Candidatus Lloydiibacteriota TaxID=1817910 RepID=A0A1G2DAY7_9BACT|nr:MAG: hypothetical protein A3D67_01180 [Candidatus Lloydbacteria bacterium RIFCSPHIGHO2_02_FULL_51_22]OGZ15699.1 MAG: hypothetical protein A3J08_01460 [Candidatus Lloydbacteria bacterium RIFCSPLOWO2_02_FULL_51_11]